MSTTPWPYKVSDYPKDYVTYIKNRSGISNDADLIAMFEENNTTPQNVPHDIIDTKTGSVLRFEKGRKPEQQSLYHLGRAFYELDFDQAGEVYFESTVGEPEKVAERINFCRRMFREPFELYCEQSIDDEKIEWEHYEYYIRISNRQDEAVYKLTYG